MEKAKTRQDEENPFYIALGSGIVAWAVDLNRIVFTMWRTPESA